MYFTRLVLALMVIATITTVAVASTLEMRQTDCEKQYGSYPEYTGPCEETNCGASGTDCSRSGQGCVPYPSFVCPPKGCACTSY